MLGCERRKVLGKPLCLWLPADCHNVFYQHLKQACASSEGVVDEIALRCDGGLMRHISLVSSAVIQGRKAGHICRTALVDITPLKEKEVELTHSRQQLRDLSTHLDRIREEERRHLAREIHDELGQKLTALRFEVAMLEMGQGAASDLPHTAASLLKQIDETIEAVRTIATDLRPAVLDLGLAAAIEWQVQEFHRRTGIACDLDIDDDDVSLDNERATAVFRIVQESLTNIVRHAHASNVLLTLHKAGNRLQVEVEDDGVGLASDALRKSRSFGLVGMRERALLLDGALEISSKPGQGTKLKVSIPL